MKRVLVCALDWGLGHATRAIAVIRELQRQGAEVVISSSGSAGTLLKQEFPSLVYHELPGYRPEYPRGDSSMVLTLARQGAHFARVVREEHKSVEGLVRKLGLHAVVSENRYGCFSRSVRSVLITHQLKLRMPAGWGFLAPLVNGRVRGYARRFSHVWVPDQPGGELTAPFITDRIPHTFIGWLSRFTAGESAVTYDIVAVVSGPDPQRKEFEDLLRREFSSFAGKALLVQGLPDVVNEEQIGNFRIVNHLPAAQLERALHGAGLVISRGGYSTVMDLIALGKRAVFVPTPQQTEQLYLAETLKRRRIAFSMHQENFALETALREAPTYSGLGVFKGADGLLRQEMERLLA